MAKEAAYTVAEQDSTRTFEAPDLAYRPPTPKNYRPRMGLIGCGGITQTHLTAYREQGLDVVMLCDIRREAAEARQEAFYPHARVVTDHRQVLEDASIDVVDVALHPRERVPVVLEALKAGKHVLSQKPFAVDLEEGQSLVEAAEQNGVKLAVNQNGRWAPHVAYLREATRARLVGQVSSVDLSIAWNHNGVVDTPFDQIPHLVLYDFAIHWFDMLHCYLRDHTPRSVFAQVKPAAGQKTRPPLLAQVLVDFDDAQASILLRANTAHGHQDSSTLIGEHGTLRSTGPNLGEQTVTLHTDQGHATATLEGTWFPSGFAGTMGELLCAIEEDRQPSNSGADNLHSLALCFAAMASAERGEPVPVGEVRKMDPSWLSYAGESEDSSR